MKLRSTWAAQAACALAGLALFETTALAQGAVAAGASRAGSPFDDAVAAWHFRDLNDSTGANRALKPLGAAKVGVPLQGDEREASLARGGDGFVAELSPGSFDAGQGAHSELNLSGEAMTMLIRLRDPSGRWDSSVFSKYGNHDKLVYNLFAFDFGGGPEGMSLGFELGIAGKPGLGGQVKVLTRTIGPTAWHDVIVRYDGKALQLFVDGVKADGAACRGALRQGNPEPLILGGHSAGGVVQRPFRGQIDHAALWTRALTDGEIAALSGGEALIRKRKQEMEAQQWAELPKPVADFRKTVKSSDRTAFAEAALALRRWMIANDPHRPLYHFTGAESWINDPNGVIFHQGEYHLFYQFNPIVDGRKSATCWGHAASRDLVHWADWPVALWPDTPHDRGGCYSGNMVIDDRGVPTALYTGNVAGHRETYGMLARSTDGFLTWQKKRVMDNAQRPNPQSPVHWDAQLWKQGDTWFQLIGGTTGGQEPKGAAYLWTSPDLERWTLQKPIYSGGPGQFWELPYLLPFGDKHALLIGVGGNPYWIGTYDPKTMTFTPDSPKTRSADPGDYYSYNPHMVDGEGPGGTPRRIMHGWVQTPPTPTQAVPYWQGAHSVPRVITLRDGRLFQEPIPEITVLRGEKHALRDLDVGPESKRLLEGIRGDALEILAVFQPGTARRLGLKVRASADGKVGLPVWFDARTREFGVADRHMTSDLAAGEPLRFHVFVDRSIIEVYLNGNAITKVALLDPGAQSVEAFAEDGHCTLQSLEVWQMKSMWE